ncbi:hypothetical protein DFQ14_103136 [Halopolyspora algeriensis]|uniref:DivIVA protein n=1 Tax=Halopolyspora algeriensis TaxID=1500506 RepID=A0A368VT35_9ACTN|nr:hypothetical protein [Halopolyspora algeriensis]RCW45172.1 hypothetical protein DFQ14_103136 [Halopolyspora algeriensis]TQM53109.1 hypothetical protein FHU43_2487 [Halopolyspora algeriensis]
MDDADEAVIPLRPGFDVQFRGFHRNQVIEHLEVLEDQLKIVTIDRNEAVRLNSDLRKLYDSTRQDLHETRQQLKRIESSDTGLPAASQRVQNMLANAEEEVQTLREQAQHQAENIRGAAESEADQLVEEAENATREFRAECSSLLAEVEKRRDQMRREHAAQVRDIREREHRMRKTVRDEYKAMVAAAQQEADELITRAQQECGQRDAASEQFRLDVQEEASRKRTELEQLRQAVLSCMDKAADAISESTTVLHAQAPSTALEPEPLPEPPQIQVRLPEQRDDVQTYTVPLNTNGAGLTSVTPVATDGHDASRQG